MFVSTHPKYNKIRGENKEEGYKEKKREIEWEAEMARHCSRK
jgi:hypothetical protein